MKQTPAQASVAHGLTILAAILEAADAESARARDEGNIETLHELVCAAREMLVETSRLATPLLEAPSEPEPGCLALTLDARTRRLLGIKAAGLGCSVERLAGSILRREAGSAWIERRRMSA